VLRAILRAIATQWRPQSASLPPSAVIPLGSSGHDQAAASGKPAEQAATPAAAAAS